MVATKHVVLIHGNWGRADTAREIYDDLVYESGRAQWEVLLGTLRLSKVTNVDYAAIRTPVLVIGGECDRIVPALAVRQTAARYQHGTSVEIPQADHMVFSGSALAVTMGIIDDWIARKHLLGIA